MAHPRKIIRASVKSRLLGAAPSYATLAEDRVFDTMKPIASIDRLVEEGPIIMVYVRGEDKIEYPSTGYDGGTRRTLEIIVEALTVASQGQSVDDRLDDLAEQIEALLEDHKVTEFPSGDFKLQETQIDVTDTQDTVLGGVFMTYEFRYFTGYRRDTSPGFLPDEARSDGQGRPAPPYSLHGIEVVDGD